MVDPSTQNEQWLSERLNALADAKSAFAHSEQELGSNGVEPRKRPGRRSAAVLAACLVALLLVVATVVGLNRSQAVRVTSGAAASSTVTATEPEPTAPLAPTPPHSSSRADDFGSAVAGQLGPSFSVVTSQQIGDDVNSALSVNLRTAGGALVAVQTSPAYKGAPAVVDPALYKQMPAPDGLVAYVTSSGIETTVVVNEPSTGYDVTITESPQAGLSTDQMISLGSMLVEQKP
jgi:hypothetical protein